MAMLTDLCSADEIPCIPKLAVAVLFKDSGVSQSNPDFVTKLVSSLDKNLNPTPKVRCKRGVERSGKSDADQQVGRQTIPEDHELNSSSDINLVSFHCCDLQPLLLPSRPLFAWSATSHTRVSCHQEAVKGFRFQEVASELQSLMSQYYTYIGSQTYPPCYQGVQWMVAKTIVPVSSSVINSFKRLQGDNVRPTFALGR